LEGCIAFGLTPGIKWLYVILPQRCLTFLIFGGRKMVFDWYCICDKQSPSTSMI